MVNNEQLLYCSADLADKLECYVRQTKEPPVRETMRLARQWLEEIGQPTDICNSIIATKALEDLRRKERDERV